MTKKKSLLVILCIFGLSALVFSQCLGTPGKGGQGETVGVQGAGVNPSGSDSKTGSQTVRASVSMDPKEFEIFSRMSKQYADQHEGIQIQVENIPAKDAYDKWKKAGQIGEAPDLMLLDNNWVQEFAALGFLQPVGDFFSSDQQNGRISTLMNQVKWNGYIWGVPKDVDPYIIVWNKKTAAQHKLEQAPRSPDELLLWSKSLLKPEEGKFGIYLDPLDPYGFIALTSALTGAWLDAEKLWKDPAAAEKKLSAFLAPQEESWAGKAYPKNFPAASSAWSPWEELAKGNIGAMVTTVSAFKQQSKDDLAIASIPAFNNNEHPVWLKGRSFTISSRTPHARLLMNWIKEMTVPETEIKSWNQTKILPAQIPSYNLAPLRGDEHINSYDWLIQQGKVFPPAAELPKNLNMLASELQKLWKGESSVKQLIENTDKGWVFPSKSK
ncbi:sugar ABC transporter substrate-binding protein [Gorillibacterium sp. sgz5001074]|uniref:sugar ABC transporter substrate-binding protein n=1 Tax=Gorillibacterium sp. sgz5001074 TaxID=3446695 RepID=UPI003F66B516